MDVLTMIGNTTDEQIKDMRKALRETLIRIGKHLGDKHFIEWAKSLSDNGLDMCLHYGFSEFMFVKFLGGEVELQAGKVTTKIQTEKH